MSLRPRYSLLTLLVVMALVAGGVKLWHGPHHVVEGTGTDFEEEYDYTRVWTAERMIQGPRVRRKSTEGIIHAIYLGYFRQGVHTGVHCFLNIEPDGRIEEAELPEKTDQRADRRLSAEERVEWRTAIARERQHALKINLQSKGSPD